METRQIARSFIITIGWGILWPLLVVGTVRFLIDAPLEVFFGEFVFEKFYFTAGIIGYLPLIFIFRGGEGIKGMVAAFSTYSYICTFFITLIIIFTI